MGAQPQRLPRREVRVRKSVSLVLVVKSEDGEEEQTVTTLDIGERGLRVATRLRLSEGQTVYAFSRQGKPQFGRCRVVWTHHQEQNRLIEAGLEIIR